MFVHTLIIGGGIGGLTAAALLAKTGHDVTLLEASLEWGGGTIGATASGIHCAQSIATISCPSLFCISTTLLLNAFLISIRPTTPPPYQNKKT
nr:FAD-dependent oxidoreductase [Domibacillus sp. A3M-37]